jgi:hypothetical protein
MDMSGQLHGLSALSREKDPVPIGWEDGGLHSVLGMVTKRKKLSLAENHP